MFLRTLVSLLLLATACAHACPQRLRVGFPDTEMGALLRGNGSDFETPPGVLVDAMRQVARELGCELELQRRPAKRLKAELEHGEFQLGLALSASPERLARLRYPLTDEGQADPRYALGEARISWFALRDRGLRTAPPLAGKVVGVLRGSTQLDSLRAQGADVQEAPDLARGLEMLRQGRFELLLAPQALMGPAALAETPAIRELQPSLGRAAFYAAAHPGFAQQQPVLMAQLWRGLCQRVRQLHPAGVGDLPACPGTITR